MSNYLFGLSRRRIIIISVALKKYFTLSKCCPLQVASRCKRTTSHPLAPTLDQKIYGAVTLVPKCPDSSAPVRKCLVDTLADTSALVPNCLDLQPTFFATVGCTEERLVIIIKKNHYFYSYTQEYTAEN